MVVASDVPQNVNRVFPVRDRILCSELFCDPNISQFCPALKVGQTDPRAYGLCLCHINLSVSVTSVTSLEKGIDSTALCMLFSLQSQDPPWP